MQPLVTIDCAKRIVKTIIAGGSYSGTVKEFINIDDYKVRITGVVVDTLTGIKQYPFVQVQILKDFWIL
ncbi:MAG: DUF6046 domain-containing protein [Prevotellaceae bacterium]|nr:DUF6046 domain-containing protein [Prevotellaceae bacterium]